MAAVGGRFDGNVGVKEDKPVEVYYDGSCAFCKASREWAEKRDADGVLRFCDGADPAAADRLLVEPERLAREMIVRLPGGRVVGGFDAALAVLGALPHWHLLAAILALPPLRWLGPPVYRMVARHRHRLGSGTRRPPC